MTEKMKQILSERYLSMGISREVYDFGEEILAGLKERFFSC